MFWAGSIVLRYTIALLLNTFLILLLKFSLDRCTGNMGYHIFTMQIQLPAAICQPIGHWVSSARIIDSMQNGGGSGAFNQPTQNWFTSMFQTGTSIGNSFGLDTLPVTLIGERTTPRMLKLLLYWLLPPFILALIIEVAFSFRSSKV